MNKTIIIKLLLSIMLFTYVSVEPTGASFSDKEINTNNLITSGWWKKPEVTITMPEGGEIYSLGDTVPIEWEVTLTDPTSDYIADVYISKDSGTNYDQVANDLDNATNYDWEIPNDPAYKTTHMMVKVVIEDDHNLIGQDESEEFDPIDLEEIKEETEEVNKEEKQQENEEVSKEEIENEANIPTEEEIIEKNTVKEEPLTTETPEIEENELVLGEYTQPEKTLIEESTEDNVVEEEIIKEEDEVELEEKENIENGESEENTEEENITEESEEIIK